MAQAKTLSSFMSLPPELRNRVYELALRPQNNGDGGIEGCRAIYVGLNARGENGRFAGRVLCDVMGTATSTYQALSPGP